MAVTPASELDRSLPVPDGDPGESGVPGRWLSQPSPFFFGLGTLGISIAAETFGAFAYFYYIDHLGLAFSLAALVRTLYAIWDAFNDPLFSYLSDNTRTPWGRRRPWLLVSVPLFTVSFVLIFFGPTDQDQQSQLFWYLLGITLLYETFITIAGVNYNALFPELFRTLPDRVRAGAYNRAGLILGLTIGLAVTPIVFRQPGFQKMALIYAALAGSLLLTATLRHREDPDYQTPVIVGPWTTFREIVRGRAFWLYAFILTVFAFAVNLFPFAIPFYSKYSLGADPDATALLFAVSLAAALGSVALWVKLFHRLGTAAVFLRSLAVIIAGSLMLGLVPNLVTAVIAVGVFGAGWGGCQVCFDVIRAGLVDRHFKRTGQRSEAAYYSLLGFGIHLSGILQGAAMFLMGFLFGYVSGEQPGPHPGPAFRFLISIFPALSLLLAVRLARLLFHDSTTDPASLP
ncbi:MAG: MFS transporter [Chloroflexi bacterium]|jgi:GPH family glycoside/pentoside/hexuronide:cation symporter|nr:MFS transporter [Chloroflexota bacterium]